MIYHDSIKLMDSRTLAKQIEDLSEGKQYLKDANKWEQIRKNNFLRYYNGKITAKEYAEKQRILIDNVLSNIDENYISENLPF